MTIFKETKFSGPFPFLLFGISLFFEIISVIPSPFKNFLFMCICVPACLCALHTMVPREARRVSEPKTGVERVAMSHWCGVGTNSGPLE